MKETDSSLIATPRPVLSDPRALIGSMWTDLVASQELAWLLLLRNIKARYRQTALGYVWAFVPPIAMTATWIALKSQSLVEIGQTETPYAVYVLVGTVLWQVFLEAVNSPIRLVTSSKQMLTKVNFPREALIIAGIGEVVFGVFVRLVLLVMVFAWFGIEVPVTVLLVPFGIAALIGLGTTAGLLLAPTAALFDDVHLGLATLTSLWFLLTPVVYPPPVEGAAAAMVTWNPVSPLLLQTRDWCTIGGSRFLGGFLVVTGVTVVLCLAGWVLYRIAMPHIIARMNV